MNGNLVSQPPPFFTEKEIALLQRTLLARFSADEQELFITRCSRSRVDPFNGQVWPTRRKQKVIGPDGTETKQTVLVTVMGIHGLEAIADRTGKYDGTQLYWCGPDEVWKEQWLKLEEPPTAAKAIVYRKDHAKPEVAIARWKSYAGQLYDYQKKTWYLSDFWDKMDDFMLAKCAKAAGLRAKFPDQLSGVYVQEELDANIDTETVSEEEDKVASAQAREAAVTEKLTRVAGARKVTVTKPETPRPTPAQAMEPAFPEDEPLPPKETPKAKPELVPEPAPVAATPAAPPLQDELQMGPGEPAPIPQTQEPPEDLSWKEHVLKGIPHPRFNGRKVGALTPGELEILADQWIPRVREQWDTKATEENKADIDPLLKAIAFHEVKKPW